MCKVGTMRSHQSWMSCRQQPATQRGFDLLPQFNMPPEVVDFSLESRPPSLPPRNCILRVLSAGTISFFCIVGVYSIAARATGPVLTQGASIAMDVKNRVGTAISQANKQEGERIHHHESVDSQSRRLELEVTPAVATSYTDLIPPAPLKPQAPSQPDALRSKTKNKGSSSLLLRMAALTKRERSMGSIEAAAVQRYFPEWRTLTPNDWKEKPELRDIVLAVSQLSQHAHVESEQSVGTPR
jgi:hypothetical protein